MLKRGMLVIVIFCCTSPLAALAAGPSFDLIYAVAQGPDDPEMDFGSDSAPGIGVSLPIASVVQFRADLQRFVWKERTTAFPFRIGFLFLGARLGAVGRERNDFPFFLDLGIALSEMRLGTESETKLGLAPGFGFQIAFENGFGVGAFFRAYLMEDGVGRFQDQDTQITEFAGFVSYSTSSR